MWVHICDLWTCRIRSRGHCTGRGSQNQSDLAAAVSPLVRPSGALRAGQIHHVGFSRFRTQKNTISLASYIPINHNKSSRTHYHQLSIANYHQRSPSFQLSKGWEQPDPTARSWSVGGGFEGVQQIARSMDRICWMYRSWMIMSGCRSISWRFQCFTGMRTLVANLKFLWENYPNDSWSMGIPSS